MLCKVVEFVCLIIFNYVKNLFMRRKSDADPYQSDTRRRLRNVSLVFYFLGLQTVLRSKKFKKKSNTCAEKINRHFRPSQPITQLRLFAGRPSLSGPVRERLFEGPQIRRMNSCDDALKNVGIVRNIPIRVEKTDGPRERLCQSTVNITDQLPMNGARRHSDFPSEFRQTTTFGYVSYQIRVSRWRINDGLNPLPLSLVINRNCWLQNRIRTWNVLNPYQEILEPYHTRFLPYCHPLFSTFERSHGFKTSLSCCLLAAICFCSSDSSSSREHGSCSQCQFHC